MRCPLIAPSYASVYPLDIQATWSFAPPGGSGSGMDRTFREPIISRDVDNLRASARQELAEIIIPCQVEDTTFERLRMVLGGDADVTNMVFVFHRRDLDMLGLLDANQRCTLKPGDRIDHIEDRLGNVTLTFSDAGLYILEVRRRSWGFGPTGYDLECCYTTSRSALPLGK